MGMYLKGWNEKRLSSAKLYTDIVVGHSTQRYPIAEYFKGFKLILGIEIIQGEVSPYTRTRKQ
jgi:hypothetical protein